MKWEHESSVDRIPTFKAKNHGTNNVPIVIIDKSPYYSSTPITTRYQYLTTYSSIRVKCFKKHILQIMIRSEVKNQWCANRYLCPEVALPFETNV